MSDDRTNRAQYLTAEQARKKHKLTDRQLAEICASHHVIAGVLETISDDGHLYPVNSIRAWRATITPPTSDQRTEHPLRCAVVGGTSLPGGDS